jgi:hypothetical protein
MIDTLQAWQEREDQKEEPNDDLSSAIEAAVEDLEEVITELEPKH